MISPPRPPSPPSGPPNSMNFSRRKLTQPAPPSPDFTKILHSSRNFIGRLLRRVSSTPHPSPLPPVGEGRHSSAGERDGVRGRSALADTIQRETSQTSRN